MLNYLRYLNTFYQEETVFKICGIITITAIPSVFLFISMHDRAARVRNKFDVQSLKRYYRARLKGTLSYLFCTIASLAIVYPVFSDFEKAPISIIMEGIAVVLYYRALFELLHLEAGIAAFMHLYIGCMGSYAITLQCCGDSIAAAVGISLFACTVLFSLIYNCQVGDPYAQRYLGIKSTDDLVEQPSVKQPPVE